MDKRLLSALLMVSFLAISPVFGCSSSMNGGTPTGGACSISELNAKVEQQKTQQNINVDVFKKEPLISPSQKIICRYSNCLLKDVQINFGSMEGKPLRGK